jgi:hypothetical protein
MRRLLAFCACGLLIIACSSSARPLLCGSISYGTTDDAYCYVSVSGLHGIPTSYSSEPLPAGCHSCDCIPTEFEHPTCETCCGCHDNDGAFVVYGGSCTP